MGLGVVAMLRNFLEGCAIAKLKFTRIILQTGGKARCEILALLSGFIANELGSIMAFIRDRIKYQPKRTIRGLNWGQISTIGILWHCSLNGVENGNVNGISFSQEDLLAELAPKYGFDYVVVRPMTIIGAVEGNFLNLA
jgi:hypothetical protein